MAELPPAARAAPRRARRARPAPPSAPPPVAPAPPLAPPVERAGQTLVIAHGPSCADGRVAACAHFLAQPAAARARLEAEGGMYGVLADDPAGGPPAPRNTTLRRAAALLAAGHPIAYAFAQPDAFVAPELVRGRRLVLLDLSLERCLPRLVAAAAAVEVYDHHDSAAGLWAALRAEHPPERFGGEFDLGRSGARLAWDAFHPGAAPPPLVRCTEDRDLNEWRYPRAREVSWALSVEGHLAAFGNIAAALEAWRDPAFEDGLAARGALYLRQLRHTARSAALRAEPAVMRAAEGRGPPTEYHALLVNCGVHATEVAEEAARAVAPALAGPAPDFVAVWHHDAAQDLITVSLRWLLGPGGAPPAAPPNLARVARAPLGGLPGGGHRGAASFKVRGCSIWAVFAPRAPAARGAARPPGPGAP